jgi:DNA-binding XRE family transcriptional regulator
MEAEAALRAVRGLAKANRLVFSMKTTQLKIKLDGRTFRGRVPCSASKKRPELGPLIGWDDFGVFEGKMVQSIFARRLLGPESFRFCRKFCEMSMQAVADLLQVDRRTVQRWESEESPVPPWAMLLVSKMADERSKGRAVMRSWLTELADEEGRPTEIDVDVA